VSVSAAGRVRVTLAASPSVLGTFPEYKIEAVECLPGSTDALLGTDDENLGGYVRTMPFCEAWPRPPKATGEAARSRCDQRGPQQAAGSATTHREERPRQVTCASR